jgi:hypothetical protein
MIKERMKKCGGLFESEVPLNYWFHNTPNTGANTGQVQYIFWIKVGLVNQMQHGFLWCNKKYTTNSTNIAWCHSKRYSVILKGSQVCNV